MISSKTDFLSNLFIFLLFLTTVTCEEKCSSVQCSDAGNEPEVIYPFRIKDLQDAGCGYPGFNLTCNTFDKTVIKLPQSGEFLVRKIDYTEKEIRLYDQNNCLARRFQQQDLAVNLSPFKAFAYRSYNFFNCPPSISDSNNGTRTVIRAFRVPCMSTPTNIVAVTLSSGSSDDFNSTRFLINGGCEMLAPVTIPIPFKAITKIYSYDFSSDDLYLTWVEPKKPEDRKKGGKKFDWVKFATIITPIIGGIGAIATIVKLICMCKRKR
ncbi:hypothetical protein MKX03_031467 [Papaver bracteatum]|nr:hypothetical protein MKX03_031467 [Papaver bracteatum]